MVSGYLNFQHLSSVLQDVHTVPGFLLNVIIVSDCQVSLRGIACTKEEAKKTIIRRLANAVDCNRGHIKRAVKVATGTWVSLAVLSIHFICFFVWGQCAVFCLGGSAQSQYHAWELIHPSWSTEGSMEGGLQ